MEVTPISRHTTSGKDMCDSFESYELKQLSQGYTPGWDKWSLAEGFQNHSFFWTAQQLTDQCKWLRAKFPYSVLSQVSDIQQWLLLITDPFSWAFITLGEPSTSPSICFKSPQYFVAGLRSLQSHSLNPHHQHHRGDNPFFPSPRLFIACYI